MIVNLNRILLLVVLVERGVLVIRERRCRFHICPDHHTRWSSMRKIPRRDDSVLKVGWIEFELTPFGVGWKKIDGELTVALLHESHVDGEVLPYSKTVYL